MPDRLLYGSRGAHSVPPPYIVSVRLLYDQYLLYGSGYGVIVSARLVYGYLLYGSSWFCSVLCDNVLDINVDYLYSTILKVYIYEIIRYTTVANLI
jgi:hypothetical protein